MNAIDKRLSTHWGIAHVSGVSAVGTAQYFMLANRVTGRAHEMGFYGGGFTLGTELPSVATRDNRENFHYTSFTTSKAVNFADFNNRGAILTNIKTPLYSRSYLSINKGLNPLGGKLARIKWSGWSIPTKLKLSGHAWVNGVLRVSMGSGELRGKIKWALDPDMFEEDFTPTGPRLAHFSSAPNESPIIHLPGDVFFPFGSAVLGKSADPLMMDLLHTIEARKPRRILIEGHTDAKGKANFNMALSVSRANAVKQWLLNHGCERAASFETAGRGETTPAAPNTHSDGRDNPEGRARNRRVEIKLR